jgi:hypothetical protein
VTDESEVETEVVTGAVVAGAVVAGAVVTGAVVAGGALVGALMVMPTDAQMPWAAARAATSEESQYAGLWTCGS